MPPPSLPSYATPMPNPVTAPGGGAISGGAPAIPSLSGPSQGGQQVSNGLMQATPLHIDMANQRRQSETTQAAPMIGSLAAHVRECWSQAKIAKQQQIEERMLASMRARRGEYDPDKIAAIRQMGGSEIYAMLTSVKCRAAASWIKDVLGTSGSARPWSIEPTPVPDLTPGVHDAVVARAVEPLKQATLAGVILTDEEVRQILLQLKAQALNELNQEARDKADLMANKMEDQLLSGKFDTALDSFCDDITTFPTAILKGPVTRMKPTLKWAPDGKGGFKPEISDTLVIEWERVSPFNFYPSPSATSVDDGFMIERHKLTRDALNAMIGVEGYDAATIRVVLDQYARGGLNEWMTNDSAIAQAEGKTTASLVTNPDGLIDAIQFFGSVPGKLLIEWGLDPKSVEDPTKEYHVEAWLIGSYVIKAVLNYDPLNRKPYYTASYEKVPGSFWGNSVADLVRDCQHLVNAAARSLVNNMGIASGPQVGVNVDRMASGEDITQLTPWKIWQFNSDPMNNGTQPPMQFFQPESHVAELMGIFEKFSEMADEYSGIPKYLAGDAAGGAGRTASGLAMLMNNAGKSIKQVISNVDMGVISPVLDRLYSYNMQFGTDPDLMGDISIRAHGASALITKDAAQMRRNEFLASTANPFDMQILGLNGRASVLREVVKTLDMNPDKIIPPDDMLRAKMQEQAAQQAAAAQAQLAPPKKPADAAPNGSQGGGNMPSPTANPQTLADGSPITRTMQAA